ncbi:GNAT family N-acetyltransferase [Kitasatospora sp. MY 5-36]|uniref:GNAT family N-acetyltransferase n=1 Tax=unclassified Kitasatospora TaxID=2633591 RepID=UPI000670EC4C|nr:GNAT family N-acetyltransferase [Kitasatospora sp. MY 5-36]
MVNPRPDPRSDPLYVRTAVPADLPRLAALRAEAAAWIALEHGSAQWSDPYDAQRGLALIALGLTVVAALSPHGEAVATLTLRPTGSPRLWTGEELALPARYVSSFTVDRRYAGHGIGTRLGDWASWRAARAGATLLRANVWSDNAALHAYYRARGWRWVRTAAGSRSGALFERAADAVAPPLVHEAGRLRA